LLFTVDVPLHKHVTHPTYAHYLQALSSKTLQLELVTQNFSSLRADYKEQSAAHEAALAAAAAATAAVEAKLASSTAALEQLQSQHTSLAAVEREKRAAAVLKMKNDMRALATEQFAAASVQHRALQVSLPLMTSAPHCRVQSVVACSKSKSIALMLELGVVPTAVVLS
jgi:septal ring factor EnvC (AmiA/AmiB activator)